MEDKTPGILVPYTELSASALRGIVEEFVTREGTDYGEVEYTFDKKVEQVIRLLHSGRAFISFDPDTETTTIVTEVPPEE